MKKKNLLILSVALLVILACNISTATPTAETPNNANTIATAVAATLEASGQAPPEAELPTPLPSMPPALPQTATLEPTVTFTPTTTLSPTPSIPMASVSENTNCRTGPGKAYDYVGALTKGETAEVVGKNTISDYWIIKNPDANSTCWLWGYYATVAGNTDNLQEYIIPPTPTPAPPHAPSNLVITSSSCMADLAPHYDLTLNLSWNDNSDNEDVFFVYQDGVLLFGTAVDQNFTGDFTVLVTDSVPSEFAVSASNTAGESARVIVQEVCP